jgi:hypothetical protein
MLTIYICIYTSDYAPLTPHIYVYIMSYGNILNDTYLSAYNRNFGEAVGNLTGLRSR